MNSTTADVAPSSPDDASQRSTRLTAEQREYAILALMPMTRRIARGMAKFARNADLGDCFNDGCLGVIRAVDSYDPVRGVPLARYARTIILGSILNGIRARDPMTDVARRKVRRSDQHCLELAQQLGRLPTMREMEDHVPNLRTSHLISFRSETLSLDATLPADVHEPTDWSEDPARIVGEKLERAETVATVRAAVEALPEQQRSVVSKIYFSGYTATAVAKEWDRTPQRITQIRGAAESTLRQQLAQS